jgi:hypothetical protein
MVLQLQGEPRYGARREGSRLVLVGFHPLLVACPLTSFLDTTILLPLRPFVCRPEGAFRVVLKVHFHVVLRGHTLSSQVVLQPPKCPPVLAI